MYLSTATTRLLLEALCLTGADLCSAWKPWEAHYRTAADIYAEFHDQVLSLTLSVSQSHISPEPITLHSAPLSLVEVLRCCALIGWL